MKRNCYYLLISIFTLSLGLLNHSIYAQFDTKELEEVVIVGNRHSSVFSEQTRNIIIIQSEDILRSPARSVADLLNYFAGLDIRRRGVNGIQADAGIRGGTFDQVLILVNGIKLSDPQSGHHNFNLPIDIENIERIEVIKGPGARVYGQNAFAGAINIITKQPETTFTKIEALTGQNGLWGARASTAFKHQNVTHYLSYAHDRSDGYKFNTDFTLHNVFYQAQLNGRMGNLGLLAGFTDRHFGANGFYASPDFMDQYEEVQTSLVALTYKNAWGANFQLNSRLFWRRNQDMYLFIRQNPDFFRNFHIGNTVGAELHGNYSHGWGALGVGLEFQQNWLSSNNLGSRRRRIWSFFVEERIRALNDRLQIMPGVNISHYDDFGAFIFPGIDMGYQLSSSLSLFGNVGYTYRVPTFTNLFYEDPANEGNPDLDAEYALSYEIGVKTKNIPGFVGQLSYFIRDGNRIIDWIKEDSAARWRPINLLDVQFEGIDGNVVISPKQLFAGKIPIWERLDIGYTFIAGSSGNTGVFSRYALEHLKHQFTGRMTLRYHPKIIQQLSFRYFDRVNLPSYSIINTQIEYVDNAFRVFLSINNLGNQSYFETNLVEMPGRWISGGISYRFQWANHGN